MREGFAVVQEKDNKFVAEFKNVQEAAELTGLHASHIYSCVNGKRKRTGGFSFKRSNLLINGERWQIHPIGINVSDHGRVKTQQNRITYGFKTKRYHTIKWNQKNHYVHRLVLEAFVGPAPSEHECDHIDRNPSNNKLENLRWVTHYENMKNK